jgi:hypothetical protein
MGIETTQYVRKPLFVDAVQVTEENFNEMVSWCNGNIEADEGSDKQFIRIWVHNPMGPRQTKAFVGDWILKHTKGFKIYTDKAFQASFDAIKTAEDKESPREEMQVTVPPSPVEEYIEPPVAAQPTPTPVAPVTEEPRLVTETDENHKLKHEPQPQQVKVQDTSSSPPPFDAGGKRVLTVAEQREMTGDQVRELLKSGDVILAQDLAEGVTQA